MKTLEVFLRTCDIKNVHNDWRKRYCGIDKSELLLGCLTSLVNAIKNTNNVSISLVVLDDHSSKETTDKIKEIISLIPNSKFIALEGFGYNNSNHQQWIMCRDSSADLVYSVEDDYLHCESSIQEMVDSFYFFCARLNHENIVLYPFDHPSEYNPPSRKDFIVHGSARHWRTGNFSTCVLMTTPQLFKAHWELFELLALKYNGDYLNPRTEHYEESNTIFKIWDNGHAVRFNPIPSLALHMQFDLEKDPFIDWQKWWSDYTKIKQ